MEKPFPIEALKSALIAIRPKISESQMPMLRAHYIYRTLSMERIANFGGYGNYRAGNSQYGALCGRIARELNFTSPGDQTYTLATVAPERDEHRAAQWEMDDEVVKALDETGWFNNVAEEKPELASSESANPPEVEREALIKARVGQGNFRMDVIALWGSCAVTGCSLTKVLNASHIVPWAGCATNREKLDPFNGLLLTPNLDKLFDRLLIAFNDDGSILLSKDLGAKEREILGVSEQTKLRFVRPAMLPYLQRHRQLFHEKLLHGQIVEAQAI
jgi:HNH endonuclease